MSTSDTFRPEIIDLTDLELELSRDGSTVKYPVLSADIMYAIGTFPQVSVTVSTGTELYKTARSRGNITDILQDSPEGAIGTLKAEMRLGDSLTKCVLFCGYVGAVSPSMSTSIYSVSAVLTVQLICGAAAINGRPAGGLVYFNVGGVDANSAQSLTYAYVAQSLGLKRAARSKDTEKDESGIDTTFISQCGKSLQETPAKCMADIIDYARGLGAESQCISKLADTVIQAEGALGVYLAYPRVAATGFIQSAMQALNGAPPSSVFISLLQQLFLGVVPETMGTDKQPCRLITWPLNAWAPLEYFTLELSDLLSIQEQTTYRLDQRVDLWFVTLPPLQSQTNPGKLAIYGPGVTNAAGQARCLTNKEFTDLMGRFKDNKTAELRSYAAKQLYLPGWLSHAPARSTQVQDVKDAGAREARLAADPEKAQAAQEDIAKRVAINGFLQQGCSVVNVNVQLPFQSYLKLLPFLGLMGTFELPDAQGSNVKDVKRIKTSKRYGLLQMLTMQLAASGRTITVACSARFGNVHTEKIHQQFACAHPMYAPNADLNTYQTEAMRVADKV